MGSLQNDFYFYFISFGDIHGYTIVERGLTIAIMLIGYSFFTATFLGSWTAVQVEHYRRHAQFHNRLGLIKRCTVTGNYKIKTVTHFVHHRLTTIFHRKCRGKYISSI